MKPSVSFQHPLSLKGWKQETFSELQILKNLTPPKKTVAIRGMGSQEVPRVGWVPAWKVRVGLVSIERIGKKLIPLDPSEPIHVA